jgi:GDP-fucose protein O-fucosyltransferase
MKRFMRDNIRLADIIQCAAARIVQAIRRIAESYAPGESGNSSVGYGSFDTMHIRRSDFKKLPTYDEQKDGAERIAADKYFADQRVVYIATDERDKTWFEPLRKHYRLVFLEDFSHLIRGVDPNYLGMIEQLVCAKGDKFVGTYYSTFSGYINRVRGYHALKSKTSDAQKGILNSEYVGQDGYFRTALKTYMSASRDFWHREWPIGWRDIDFPLG